MINTVKRHRYSESELELVTFQRLIENKHHFTYLGRVDVYDDSYSNGLKKLFYVFQRENGETFKVFAPTCEQSEECSNMLTLEKTLEKNKTLIGGLQTTDNIFVENMHVVFSEQPGANKQAFYKAIKHSHQDIIPFAENTQGAKHWVTLQLQPHKGTGKIIDSKAPQRVLSLVSKMLNFISCGRWNLTYATSGIKNKLQETHSFTLSATQRLGQQSLTNTKDCGAYTSRVVYRLATKGAEDSLQFKLSKDYVEKDRKWLSNAVSEMDSMKRAS